MQPVEKAQFSSNSHNQSLVFTNSADINPLEGHAGAAAAREILANASAIALSNGQKALAPPRSPVGALT
jgi:hypothetical protein